MLRSVKQVWLRRELLWILIGRNLKIRYKHSVLGFFWSLLSPLLLILIYASFATILRFNEGRPSYLQFLVIGIIVWQFLAMCLGDSLFTIMGSANLVKKTAFPRIILPLAMVLANLANFLLTWVVLFLYLMFSGMHFQYLILLPLVLLAQTLLCLGLALILSASNVFFRDTEHIMGVSTLAWFFMTPIFYPVQMQLKFLPEHLSWLAFLNPMTGIVRGYRVLLMSDCLPSVAGDLVTIPVPAFGFAISGVVCVVMFVIGVGVFQKLQSRFGDEL